MKVTIGIFIFFIKSFVLIVLIAGSIRLVFPEIFSVGEYSKKFMADPGNQALVLSFIQNPVALSISAERDIEKKRFGDAIIKLELAIGLFEMHGANKANIQPYIDRLNYVKKLPHDAKN